MAGNRAGGRDKLTTDERRKVRDLLLQLAERVGGWDALMDAAEVPRSTHPAWRYGENPTTPESATLLRLLRAAHVLNEDFSLVSDAEDQADALAAAARAQAEETEAETPDFEQQDQESSQAATG